VALILGLIGAGLLVAGVGVARSGRRLIGVPIAALGVAVLVAGVLLLVLVRVYRLPSENMRPTFAVGDRIAVLKGDVGRGDIAVFHPPAGAITGDCGRPVEPQTLCPRAGGGRAKVSFVKRVVAVGGDRIGLRDGRVILNGRELDEPFIRACEGAEGCTLKGEVTVPRGQLYLLGDNRGRSDDSRFWGPVPQDWVVGRVVFRYWPLSRLGTP
jgi:signal peptidase I